ncbi:MAG TPA: phosphate ABC transporter permease PstA [Rubrobacteraceae bacterium]|nr:phosphate ABC transporter permease PstA [Rubrobacteraceae bacterium]
MSKRDGSEREADFRASTSTRHMLDRVFTVLVFAAAMIGLVVLAALLVDVARDGLPRLDWSFITNFSSSTPERTGIYPALLGSLWLLGLTAVTSVPLGIGAAIYLEEYAHDNWLTRLIEVNISNLAGVPSIIYGLLGLGIFVNLLGSLTGGQSLISGALTLSLLILPVIIIATREALRTIPSAVREGGYALGATRWEVIRSHLLPMALPGALTGTILALSRAIGETAPLIVVGAATYITFVPEGPQSGYSALPIQIYNWVSQPQEGFQTAAAAGIVVLMLVLLLTNSVAIALRNRYQRRG